MKHPDRVVEKVIRGRRTDRWRGVEKRSRRRKSAPVGVERNARRVSRRAPASQKMEWVVPRGWFRGCDEGCGISVWPRYIAAEGENLIWPRLAEVCEIIDKITASKAEIPRERGELARERGRRGLK